MAKPAVDSVRLVAGLGIDGDAHQGVTVKHRSRVARDPSQPNLRQVHLIHAELHEELARQGFAVRPGQMGENVTSRGIDLLALPAGTRLVLGAQAVGGLMAAVLDRDTDGNLIRKAGVMGIVLQGGEVRAGDPIHVQLPPPPFVRLEPV